MGKCRSWRTRNQQNETKYERRCDCIHGLGWGVHFNQRRRVGGALAAGKERQGIIVPPRPLPKNEKVFSTRTSINLATYLNDHLGGSRFAIDLLERLRDTTTDPNFNAFTEEQ
jgi:hypothetical protein